VIVNKDTNPLNDLYYIGSLILKYLLKENIVSIEYTELMSSLKKENHISTNLLSLSLDWVYLLGAIDLDEKGNIKICF
jgi:hypothetical protein